MNVRQTKTDASLANCFDDFLLEFVNIRMIFIHRFIFFLKTLRK